MAASPHKSCLQRSGCCQHYTHLPFLQVMETSRKGCKNKILCVAFSAITWTNVDFSNDPQLSHCMVFCSLTLLKGFTSNPFLQLYLLFPGNHPPWKNKTLCNEKEWRAISCPPIHLWQGFLCLIPWQSDSLYLSYFPQTMVMQVRDMSSQFFI